MAIGDAINSEMATTLLRKIKGQEPVPKSKKDNMSLIIEELGRIQDSVDADSQEAKNSRKILVAKLLEAFEDEGLSIKEQKELLVSVDENAYETMQVLKTLNIGNINKFFTTISNPKLLGEAINKGFVSSNIGKALDVIPEMITKIGNGISKISAFANTAGSFLTNAVNSIKLVGGNIISTVTGYIKTQFTNLTTFISKSVIDPIVSGVKSFFTSLATLGNTIKTGFNEMSDNFGLWIFGTVIPMLFSIIGYLTFTVIPSLISMAIAIPVAVTTILASIFPILLIAGAILVVALIIGYLLYKAFGSIKEMFSYIFSEEFIDDIKKGFEWVWDTILKPAWNGLVATVDWIKNELWPGYIEPFFRWIDDTAWPALKTFFTWVKDVLWKEYLQPAISWIWNTLQDLWTDTVLPVFTFLKDVFMDAWKSWIGPLFERLRSDFLKGWPILMDWIKQIFDSTVGLASDLLDAGASQANTVIDFLESLGWSQFASGGIVTKPTNALIGEAGSSEAVIPLNKQGMQFIRDSFQIDDVAIQQVVKNSELFKTQAKMQVTLEIMSKDIKQIKFSLSEKKKENNIQNPPEVLVSVIKTDKLPQIEEGEVIFDLGKVEKMIQNSDVTVLNKIEELILLIKSSKDAKQDTLINPGASPVDSFHDLLKALSTGVLGVRQ